MLLLDTICVVLLDRRLVSLDGAAEAMDSLKQVARCLVLSGAAVFVEGVMSVLQRGRRRSQRGVKKLK